MKFPLVGLSTIFALAWQCCQGVKTEEGSEEQFQAETLTSEQFQAETLTLAQCSSAVKKVQETGKYTEEAIMPICSSVVRSSKCDFFSEALSLATSHTDFNGKVFCKNIGEAHFCSQTMDRLLTSPVMSDLAFGACMRDKSSRGEQYCQRFSKMHAYAVQHDDLDTMRACYMMEAYDDSESEESNSKKASTTAAVAKPQANATPAETTKMAAPKVQSTTAIPTAVGKVVVANAVKKPHAEAHGHGSKKVIAAILKHNGSKTNDTKAAKNTSAKKDLLGKNATTASKKADTSLVSSLIHTLSATVAGVAHAVAKVVLVPPTPHDGAAKPQHSGNATAAQTTNAPAKKKAAVDDPIASPSKGASLTQAQKVRVKKTARKSGKNAKALNAATSKMHQVQSKSAPANHHGHDAHSAAPHKAQSAAPSTAHSTPLVKQHEAALVGKHASSQKTQIRKKGGTEVYKKGKKETAKEIKEDKDKYGGFLSGFINP